MCASCSHLTVETCGGIVAAMDTQQEHLGHGLRVSRIRARRSAEEAAKHLGISSATILRWERGDVAMPAIDLFELAAFYETTCDAIGKDGGVECQVASAG